MLVAIPLTSTADPFCVGRAAAVRRVTRGGKGAPRAKVGYLVSLLYVRTPQPARLRLSTNAVVTTRRRETQWAKMHQKGRMDPRYGDVTDVGMRVEQFCFSILFSTQE